jgi:hypothetical protein
LYAYNIGAANVRLPMSHCPFQFSAAHSSRSKAKHPCPRFATAIGARETDVVSATRTRTVPRHPGNGMTKLLSRVFRRPRRRC